MSTLYITLKRKPKQNSFHRKPLLKAMSHDATRVSIRIRTCMTWFKLLLHF